MMESKENKRTVKRQQEEGKKTKKLNFKQQLLNQFYEIFVQIKIKQDFIYCEAAKY